MTIEVYSDGSSGAKGGKPGGWGFVIVQDKTSAQMLGPKVMACSFGGSPSTTNNLMEMEGAYQGLLAVIEQKLRRSGETVILISDSQYTLGIASGRMSPSKNIEAAEKLRSIFSKLDATTRWVPGHGFNKAIPYQSYSQDVLMNERCDGLAGLGKKHQKRLLNQI